MKFAIVLVLLAFALGAQSSERILYGAYDFPIGPSYLTPTTFVYAHHPHGVYEHRYVEPLVVGEGRYLAKNRGAIHDAPLPGHIHSVASINDGPAPGTF